MARTATSLPYIDHTEVGRKWDGKTGNLDHNRTGTSLIILHTMDGFVDGTTQQFKTHNTSAHYGIGMDGGITLYVPEDCVAYHAGRYSVNQVSIGIEHEDEGNESIERSSALYETSAKLVEDISFTYDIPLDRGHIKKHNEVVATQCPGALDVDRIIVQAVALRQTRSVSPTSAQMTLDAPTFDMLVTKANNWDSVGKFFGLNDEDLKQAGKSDAIISDVGRLRARVDAAEVKLSELTTPRSYTYEPVQGTSLPGSTDPLGSQSASTATLGVPSEQNYQNIPSYQSKSFWSQDVGELMGKLASIFKRNQNTP